MTFLSSYEFLRALDFDAIRVIDRYDIAKYTCTNHGYLYEMNLFNCNVTESSSCAYPLSFEYRRQMFDALLRCDLSLGFPTHNEIIVVFLFINRNIYAYMDKRRDLSRIKRRNKFTARKRDNTRALNRSARNKVPANNQIILVRTCLWLVSRLIGFRSNKCY